MLGSEGGENQVQNRPKTSLSTPGFCNFFSPSLSLRRSSYRPRPPPALQPPATPQEANTTTNRPPSSHRDSLSSPSNLSLSSTTFSSSSHSRLRQPSPQPTPLEPPAKPPHHA